MLQYSFMQNAVLVSVFISILCPSIGIFLVLRRYSMIGDTLSHASLAGVTMGLLAGQNPILGAFVFTSICGALIEFLRNYFKKYTDLILTIVLSLSVGTAITIISSGKLKANADSFLFGSILTVTQFDMIMVLVLSIISVLTLVLLYHQMLYIAYDEEAARVAGVRVKLINYVFSILVASAISVSIRIVGVLVLSSMIALPVATALQLGKGFRVTLILLYHQMLYIAYDEEAARVAGVRVKLINYVFSILVASAISVSIRIVGVLVLSSMIALPVATALQLGKGFRVTLIFSIVFSMVDIMTGLFVSYYLNVAPGGFTALVSVAVLVVVLVGKVAQAKLRARRAA